MKEPKESFNYQLIQLLHRTRHLILKARQKELRQYGLSFPHSGILSIIVRLDKKATPTRISRELFMEHHSVSDLLLKMETQGLIKRVKDLERKNLIRLEITEKGYDLYLKSSVAQSNNDIISALTDGEKLELYSLLVKMRAKAMGHMRIENIDIYPPSNLAEL